MPKSFKRTDRLEDHIQRELAELLRMELRDTNLGMITLSRVKISPDMGNANLYVTIYKPELEALALIDKSAYKEVIAALNERANFFRTLLAKSAKLRYTPRLRFFYDDTVARARHLSSLIDKAVAIEQKPAKKDAADGNGES